MIGLCASRAQLQLCFLCQQNALRGGIQYIVCSSSASLSKLTHGPHSASLWKRQFLLKRMKDTTHVGARLHVRCIGAVARAQPQPAYLDRGAINYECLGDTSQLPPRVEHLLVNSSGAALHVVAAALDLPCSYVADLIHYGAVFYCPQVPPMPAHASPLLVAAYEARLSDFKRTHPPAFPVCEEEEENEPAAFVSTLRPLMVSSSTTLQVVPAQQTRQGGPTWSPGWAPVEGAPQQHPAQGAVAPGEGGQHSASATTGDKQEQQEGDARGRIRDMQQQQQQQQQVGRMRKQERAKPPPPADKPRRLQDGEEVVQAGGYMRVHVHPKRFFRCYEVDWKKLILAETDDYVVINKPSGVPVAGAVCNRIESCTVFAARALALPEPLRPTHMLDTCTQGCLVMAKTAEFAALFNMLLQKREVHKTYRALAVAPVALGRLIHYMRRDRYPPRIVVPEERPGWFMCELQVLSCTRLPWPTAAAAASVGAEIGGWFSAEWAYECTIRLITGRTHQLRAQLAAIGAPLIGDTLYMPAAMARHQVTHNLATKSNCGLQSSEESLALSSNQLIEGADVATEVLEDTAGWEKAHGLDPSGAVGLQAWQIFWDDPTLVETLEAGLPWWREDLSL